MNTLPTIDQVLKRVVPHPDLDWTLSNTLTAKGFGVTDAALRMQKQRRSDELIEGKHWIKNGRSLEWSRRGIVRLGFHLEGDRPREFRNACENYLLENMRLEPTTHTTTPSTLPPELVNECFTLDDLARDLAFSYLEELPVLIEKHIRAIAETPDDDCERIARLNMAFAKSYPALRSSVVAAMDRLKKCRRVAGLES